MGTDACVSVATDKVISDCLTTDGGNSKKCCLARVHTTLPTTGKAADK